MSKKFTKVLSTIIGLFMMMSFFAGCGGGESKNAEQAMTFNLASDPKTIDPGLNSAVESAWIVTACFEGLTRIDEDNKVKPGVAEKWEISPDGKTYTFHLRKDVKWSDGKAITAKDFEYAWKRVLTPATAAEYANMIYDYIQNGEEFYNNKVTWENVGVKAKDDSTLEVTLKSATPYFLEITAFPTYMPVRQDMVEKDPQSWATKAETYIGNGPFKLDKWGHNDAIELSKNDNYWDKDKISMNKITAVMVVEPSEGLLAWEKGDIDYIDNVPASEASRLIKEGKLDIQPQFGTYYVIFNTKKAPLNNPKVRRALSLAINREFIVNELTKCGEKPATAFIGYGSYDADKTTDFRTKGGDYYNPKGDIAEAKKLLAEAGYPNGKGFPSFTYLYNTSDAHKKIAEAVQDMWKKNLNINVKLANQEWKVFQNTKKQGNFDIARAGWIADFMDPVSMMDIFVSNNGNNDGKYNSPEYDKLIKSSKETTDPAVRFDMLHKAEKVIMDDMPIAPLYFYVNKICQKPYIKGVYKIPTGNIYFDYATFDQAAKDEYDKGN